MKPRVKLKEVQIDNRCSEEHVKNTDLWVTPLHNEFSYQVKNFENRRK